jgi:death-on-curing protein
VAWRYLDLADYFVIAQAATRIPAETLMRAGQVHLAESALSAAAASFGGVEFYPEFEVKAAVLCARIVKNHALPDGNKRTAYLCLREFVERNGRSWRESENDPDETVAIIEGVAAGELSEEELAEWIRGRTS